MQTVNTKECFSRHTNLESEMIKEKWVENQSDELNTTTTVKDFRLCLKEFYVEQFGDAWLQSLTSRRAWHTESRKVAEMDPHVIEEMLESFVAWISDQPELPQNMDKIVLVRYLKASKFNLSRAKDLLKNSLKMRRKFPHIFTQRDPMSKEMRNIIDIV